ncbi:LacI family DNA-binding transcriptional regulator [Actinopolymorpha singaporensis]|uniref:Transcriptional regulator, LacI family n=1 Tax=Actinopolymorpha singaporensis TaxID=117157 RepID=A0A1H1UND8_9ACTN|nr:LacI family DNA-binding transcriptional regulator [Actinopolymorpha singaporensis]SDS74048.1 transcriptional regulator, LacI family [Actinopolymorpha singaporensis]
MAVTIEDVARRAGVSRGTVSNVLNRPDVVSEATRARVLAAMSDLDFIPSQPARMLGGLRNRSIGLVMHDVGHPFFAEIARGVEDVTIRENYVLTLTSTRDDAERERSSLRLLIAQQVSGILLIPTASGAGEVQQVRERGVAAVLLDHEGGAGECSVAVDDIRGGIAATQHLLSLGHRRLAFVGGPGRGRQHSDRLSGMRSALTTAGGRVRPGVQVVTVPADTIACGEEAARSLLADSARRSRPTGILCGNDLLAVGLMRGLGSAGVSVPDDVAVVGYDDIELATLVGTPITSVRQPMYEMGHTAAELLVSEIRDRGHTHRNVRFVPELVVRDSTVRP